MPRRIKLKTKGLVMNKKLQFIFIIIYSFVCAQGSMATSLYQQQVEQAKPDDKMLQKTLKQIKDHKEIKLIDELLVPAFHKRSEARTSVKQSICMNCHQPLPHRKNERSRTFMNMHSKYIACETCHLRPENIDLEYRWLVYDGANAGEEVAARVEQDNKDEEGKSEQRPTLIPKLNAKIAPYYQDRIVLEFKDDDFSRKSEKDWKEADKNGKAKLKARLHVPLEEKGPECQRCHGDDKPMLDLEKLGATEKQVREFQRNVIVRFFTRFKKDDQRIRIKDLLK